MGFLQEGTAYKAFQYKEFRFFVLARFLVTIAIQIQSVVVGWMLYEITKDPLSLGLIGLAEAIPALSVALYAGYITDTTDRRRIVFLSILTLFVGSLLLLITIHFQTSYIVTILYAIIFLEGIARGFYAPSAFSLLTQLIPKEIFTNATTWNSSAWQIGAVVGPAIGGLSYGYFGATLTLSVSVVLFAIGLGCILAIKPKGVPDKAPVKENILKSINEGIKFVFANKVMLGALSLDLFAVLFGGAVALLPVFAKDILHTGPQGLGLLRAAPSVGAFVTMIGMAYYPPTKRAGKNMLYCVAGFGLCIICFGLSTSFLLSLILLVLSGAFDSVSVVIRSTIIQTMTPDHMRGRVSAVNTMFIGSSNEIGAFESGSAARLLGVVPSVVAGGCITLGVVIFTAWKAPALKAFKL